VIGRRQRHAEIRHALAAGEVTRSADLIALNLDLRQLVQDLVESCESPALLLDIYRALESLSVLDPTCGSGAFLFAALNVLQPLYDAALERMEAFLLDADGGETELDTFATVVERVRAHPNRGFFVLKTIVVNNLYGVDIMEEAVEICKLRLFLRLVSQIDRFEHLEPLPDIDFNVRAGNTLVGFASLEELRRHLRSRLDLDSRAGQIEVRSSEIDRAFERFRQMQLAQAVDDHDLSAVKKALRDHFHSLRTELDAYLASQYGVDPGDSARYQRWRESHLPFHWFIEFHEIMAGHGFDVIIGNPPFVEYAKVRDNYTVQGFETLASGNLYAFVLERSLRLGRGEGRMGMISSLSVVCTSRMAPLREVLTRHELHVPCFDIRPNGLFEGVTQRLCFVFAASDGDGRQRWSAGYRRWLTPERPALMSTAIYTAVDGSRAPTAPMPKFSHAIEKSIRDKLGTGSLELLTVRSGDPIYVHRIVRYFIKALDFVPLFIDAEGQRGRSDDYKPFRFKPEVTPFVVSLLNSSLFYWYWRAYSDGFHCGYGDVYLFPHEHVERADADRFRALAARLMQALRENSAEKTISTKKGTIRYQEFYAKPVKPLFDEIDTALAEHYGLTDEELSFFVSYDLKYRIGTEE
jgi:Eco57I restriction-modification methylase